MALRTALEALNATYSTPEWEPMFCLRWVWRCYGSVPSNLPPLSNVGQAKQGWIYSQHQHPGDRNPPAGAPIYFSGSDGHIAIATGNGDECRSTEWPWGQTGTATIHEIESTWNRTYWGWTGDMLGHLIDFAGTSVAGGGATPIQNKRDEDTMYLDWDTNGTGYLTTTDGVLALSSMQFYNLFYRKINANQLAHPNPTFIGQWVANPVAGRPMVFLAAEQSIMDNHLTLLSTQKLTGIQVDPDKMAAAIADALGDKFNGEIEVDADTLAAALEKATPRIVGALLKQAGQKLAS